jgi:hypothetical protein
MRTFKILLGEPGDGYGMTRTHTVVLLGRHSDETLRKNYQRNLELIGFNPEQVVAPGYENPTVEAQYIKRLEELGAKLDIETPFDEATGKYTIQEKDAVAIAMFFFTNGLEDAAWEEIQDETPYLYGAKYGAIVAAEYAEGLLY